MKKIVISLAGALAATAFAPEAAAVPAFARQTGMACSACHAQHFPVLNSFGRAFKAGGYTMMGAQDKVEGEHLSIPATLNASIVMKIRHQKVNGGATGTDVTATGAGDLAKQGTADGQWQFFDEFALLLGGRVAENVGFLLEAQMNAGDAPLAAGFKMPFVFDAGGAKLSVIPFQTDALGVTYGYEPSSGGVARANRWSEHRRETSAVQYNADRGIDAGAATGISFVAQNDMGSINFTKWAATEMNVGGGVDMDSNYIRVAFTPTYQDWAMVIGAGRMSGSSFASSAAAAAVDIPCTLLLGCTAAQVAAGATIATAGVSTAAKVDTDQTFFDFQAQGQVAGKDLGVYLQHAKAPRTAAGNAYSGAAGGVGNPDRKATTIGADYTVIPHALSLGLAYRNADSGGAVATNGDDAWTVQAIYDLYQNVALHAVYSQYSGSGHNAATSTKHLTTLMLEAAW